MPRSLLSIVYFSFFILLVKQDPAIFTEEWTKVDKGQPIPAGLDIKLSMETGDVMVRKHVESENSIALVRENTDVREDVLGENKETLQVEKNFRKSIAAIDDLKNEAIASRFRPIEELKKDMEEILKSVETESELLRKKLEFFNSNSNNFSTVSSLIDDIIYDLHGYDLAVDFGIFGGYKDAMDFLKKNIEELKINSENAVVFNKFNKLFVTALRNNDKVHSQLYDLKFGEFVTEIMTNLADYTGKCEKCLESTFKTLRVYSIRCPLCANEVMQTKNLNRWVKFLDSSRSEEVYKSTINFISYLLEDEVDSHEIDDEGYKKLLKITIDILKDRLSKIQFCSSNNHDAELPDLIIKRLCQ